MPEKFWILSYSKRMSLTICTVQYIGLQYLFRAATILVLKSMFKPTGLTLIFRQPKFTWPLCFVGKLKLDCQNAGFCKFLATSIDNYVVFFALRLHSDAFFFNPRAYFVCQQTLNLKSKDEGIKDKDHQYIGHLTGRRFHLQSINPNCILKRHF